MDKQQTIQKIISLQKQFDQLMVRLRFQNWKDTELTAVQFKCLLYISQTTKPTSKKLAEELGVTPAVITGVVDRLINQGFVHRQENIADRRFFILQPTEKGKHMIEKLNRNIVDYFTLILKRMSGEDLEHFYLGMSAVYHSFQQNLPTNQQIESGENKSQAI